MERQFYGSALCGDTGVNYYLLVEDGTDRTECQSGTENRAKAETEICTGTEEGTVPEYGALVEKDGEQAVLPRLHVSADRVRDLLDRMVRGAVTPVTARDVAEDWLLSL